MSALTCELAESRDQPSATSEVLRVISGFAAELTPVFEAMLENAIRLCEAKFGVLFRSEGEALRVVALRRAPPAYAEERRRVPMKVEVANNPISFLRSRIVLGLGATMRAKAAATANTKSTLLIFFSMNEHRGRRSSGDE